MAKTYKTAPPQLTLALIEKKHIPSIWKKLSNESFLLYVLGRNDPVPLSDLEHIDDVSMISILVEDQLHPSVPLAIAEGTLLITCSGGEASVVDVVWATGIEDPVEAYEAFLELNLSQQKSFMHPRLLQNTLIKS